MAKRALITETHVLDARQAGKTKLVIPPDALITPLAQDTARAQGIAFVTAQPEPAVPATPTRPATNIVAIGSDHGGFAYKATLIPLLQKLGWKPLDVGTDTEASCDYPDFAYAVARAVALGKADFGIMIDGAGLGSAMVCNKVPGIRAACAYNEFTAWNARAHNDAQILTLGSRTLGIEVCKSIVTRFLETAFEGGRHAGRVGKIADVEARYLPGQVK